VRVLARINRKEFWQMREISGGGSLGSQNDLRALFGLGDSSNVATLRIEWPSGITQQFNNVAARQHLTVREPSRLRAINTLEEGIRVEIKGIPRKLRIETSTNLVDWTEGPLIETDARTVTNTVNAAAAAAFLRARDAD